MNDIECTEQNNAQDPDFLRGYKTVCAKLGLSMCVYFACRLLAGFSSFYLLDISGTINPALFGVLNYANVILLTYVVPIAFTVMVFKYSAPLHMLYRRPRRLARAFGTFPAAYGLGYGVALLTLLATYIFSRVTGSETAIVELLRPPNIEPAANMAEIIMLMLLLVVAAPLFEEYWVRGIMFDALRPYGAGIAILISSIIFGFMHGNLYMLFYTTALGLALGYIRYATGSLFIVTILHAIINSISGTLLLLTSLSDITNAQNKIINTIEMIFQIFVLVLIIVGIIVFIAKIPAIRKYRFENPWIEIGPWKKIGVFFVSFPVIIMMVLVFNELSGQLLLNLMFR